MNMSTERPVDPETIEKTKQQIRSLVGEIAQLGKADLSTEQYYAEFLQKIVSALAAIGGAVWTRGESGGLELTYQINLRMTELAEQEEDQVRHGKLLYQVVKSNEAVLVPPFSGVGDEQEAGNPTKFLLVLAPLATDEDIEGVVEIFQRSEASPATQRGYLRFLVQMCELASQWLQSRKLRQLGDRQSLWGQVDGFARAVHESLDVRQTAYTIANEGRNLIGCDRVSVAVRRGTKYKIEAASGQDTFDARSNVVTLLGRLATRVAASDEALWYTGSTEDLPPQIEEALEEYVDESHSKTVAVLPLRKPIDINRMEEDLPGSESQRDAQTSGEGGVGEIIGVLIVEQIEDMRPKAVLGKRVDLVETHAALALANATDYNNMFLMPVWRAIGRASWVLRARTLPKTISITAVVLALLIGMFVYRIDFDLEGRGTLQPVIEQEVFVDVGGVVTDVRVKNGDRVEKGQVLAILRNTDLEVQLTDLIGQRKAATEQIRSINQATLREERLTKEEKIRLSGQLVQLGQRIKSLREQEALLQDKKARLTVRSPIRGQVYKWDVKKHLTHRPVGIGEVLMTIVDPDGDWELEVFMPENRMGHILRYENGPGRDEKLQVHYVTMTDPGTTRPGEVKEIHQAAELHGEHGHSVMLRVDLGMGEMDQTAKAELRTQLRPGATVSAKIHCGKASIGYVWIHEAIEFVQSRILF